MENSGLLKASIDAYVKNGGTLITFTQQHGYEFGILPTPDGQPITAIGWEEDQNCFSDGTYIETWHQMLSGQNRSTPTVNVDGYFTSYPANSTVLLRRTANGQPAMIMFDYGQGRVIATTMYSDWAYGHGQTSAEEIRLIRDMISWAKKPELLPEIKPGETASFSMNVVNSSATPAASVRLQFYNPDRSSLLFEQSTALVLPPGETTSIPVSYDAATSSSLGIHHVDYLLYDSQGNLIQPQAETDSGRFVISKPPKTGTINRDIWFSVSTNSQSVFFGSPFEYMFHIFNNTDETRSLTIKTWLPHTRRAHEWSVTASPNGETRLSGSDLFIDTNMFETLHAYLYDENGIEVGNYMLSFQATVPSLNVTARTDKASYKRGDSVPLALTLENKQAKSFDALLRIRVTDPLNNSTYNTSATITIAANGRSDQSLSFPLAASGQFGTYAVLAEAFDASGRKIGGTSTSFDIFQSRIAVSSAPVTAYSEGANTITFTLSNVGKIAVDNGIFDVNLSDPDGIVLLSSTRQFSLGIGQTMEQAVTMNVPVLKFGTYRLSYSQSDETRTGRVVTVALPNTASIAASFDKISYRVRETVNLTLTLNNTGVFNQNGGVVAISVPDASYSQTQTLSLSPSCQTSSCSGQSIEVPVAFTIPHTAAGGQSAATITYALPSGSTFVQTAFFAIPPSSVSASFDQTAYDAGSTIRPVFSNTGGVDAPVQYKFSLFDSKSVLIAETGSIETIEAGGSLPLSISIPFGALQGSYNLVLSYRDTKSGKAEIINRPIVISGVKAALVSTTDKDLYLSTENIFNLNQIVNEGASIANANLHLQVMTTAGSQKTRTWTSQKDFQQGARDGVDTYGINDWFLPSDDFDAGYNPDRWNILGTVTIQNGTTLIDSSYGESRMYSKWNLSGDFDIQVDFNNILSMSTQGAGFEVGGGGFWFYVKSSSGNGREAGALINNVWTGWQSIGGYLTSGKFRIVRSGTSITGYVSNGSGWTQLLTVSGSAYTYPAIVQCDVWRGAGYPSSARVDNFKVNSGTIVTSPETVDSVRLLPMNDNFDDGIINSDRWSIRSSGSGTTGEQNGVLVTQSTQTGIQSYSSVVGHLPFFGDFDISIDWKTPVAPSTGNWSAFLQISDADQNTGAGNLIGNALQIRRAYVEGTGHAYDTGHFNGSQWDQWAGPTATSELSGSFRIKRTGSNATVWYWNSSLGRWEWNGTTSGYTWSGMWTTPAFVQLGLSSDDPNIPDARAEWNNFMVKGSAKFLSTGTLSLKQDAGQPVNWQQLVWNSKEPIGTALTFRTRTADTEAGLGNASWSSNITASGSSITSPKARWIEIEAILSASDVSVTPFLDDIAITYGNNAGDILWQADMPVNLGQNPMPGLTSPIGSLSMVSKLYLEGTLSSSTGQIIASSEYPFYVTQGNLVLILATDKKIYRPGETVTVSGTIKNMTSIDATGLSLGIKQARQGMADENIYGETSFAIPAGGSHAFIATTTAQNPGMVSLVGSVTQNNAGLAEISDQFEVSSPVVAATVTAPAAAGSESFPITIELKNTGKADASVLMQVQSPGLSDTTTLAIGAGESMLVQYTQKIAGDTLYNIMFSGDLNQAVTRTVAYGLSADIRFGTPQNVYAEGTVAVPVTITNIGQFDEIIAATYRLQNANNSVISEQTRSYFVPKGGFATDSLAYAVTEGTYRVTAESREPSLISQSTITVTKDVNIRLESSTGNQENNALPIAVSLSNLGFHSFDGTVSVSLLDAQGKSVWNGEQQVSGITAGQTARPMFNLDTGSVRPGDYILSAKAFNASGEDMAVHALPFSVKAANMVITQTPPYQTFMPGQDGLFVFKVRNTGNQEGEAKLLFKAYDLLDANRSVWLKAGEEQEVVFTFPLPTDLDEKDYDAGYELQGQATSVKGMVKYHLTGLNIGVNASLDKSYYSTGDVAHLALTITQQTQTGSQDLFARVNYAGYEQKVSFSLDGSKELSFDIPLSEITGEKLFYGIYHSGGRSIHLNAIYIYKAGDGITLVADKQVYDPGEAISVSMVSNQPGLSGQMTLTGPGGFSETFDFSGSASRSIVLPGMMTAGTQPINAQLKTQNAVLSASLPIDVNGIQVKILEAATDRGKYSSADTIQLALTISSNRDMQAILRTWVVDPKGTYTAAGENTISLTSSDPVQASLTSQLATGISGIHRLVYGIYVGEMLLSSGSEAFDVGDAVLLGLSTDKRSYLAMTEQVIAAATLQGNNPVLLEFLVDGVPVRTDEANVNGLTTVKYALPGLTPGSHVLKAVMTTGSLSSSLETEFSFGSALPDLVTALSSGSVVNNDGTITVTAFVRNEGRTGSPPTTITLFEGDAPLDSKAVAALNSGEGTILAFSWIAIGKTGDHLLKTVVDTENAVQEYTKMNNQAITYVRIPDDVVPPVTSIGFGTPNVIVNGIRCITPDTVITLSAVDNYAGIAGTEYRVDGGAWLSSVPFTIAQEGAYSIDYRSRDSVGNTESINTVEVMVDASAPTGSIVINGGAPSTNSILVNLTLDCVDTMSGCSQMAISTDGTTWSGLESYVGTKLLELALGDGAKSFWVQYADAMGHTSQAYAAGISLDTTPPVTTAFPAEGVFNKAGNVALSANEPGTVYYTMDGSIPSTVSPVYVTPLSITETTTVSFFSIDRAGNIETPHKSATYTIDTQPPVLTVSALPDGAFTNNTTLNVAGRAEDNVAVQGVTVSDIPVALNADGTFSQAVTLATGSNPIATVAKDSAGNTTMDVRTITLDQAVPIISIISPADNSITDQVASNVTGTLDKPALVSVLVNGNPGPSVSDTQFSLPVILAYGQNTIEVSATDLAGNIGTAKRTVTLDNQNPSLSIIYPAQDMTTSQNQLTLTGQVSDMTPVVVTVSVDGNVFMPQVLSGNFSQSITFSAQKTYQITVIAVDEAGNQSQVQRNVIYNGTPQNFGVFAATTVSMSTGLVDSYDSSQGLYSGSHGSGVSIGTNSTASGVINMSGGAMDYGNVYVGPGGNTGTGIITSGGSVIYGTRASLAMPKDITPVSDPGGGTPVTFKNGTTLTTGTYRVSSINLSGGGVGTISGNVTLYVTGSLNLSGGSRIEILPGSSLTVYLGGSLNSSGGSLVNQTHNPHNLTIYGTATCTSVTYSGGSSLYGVIYAPMARTSISASTIYGSVIGRSVTLSGGAAVHYDESLGM